MSDIVDAWEATCEAFLTSQSADAGPTRSTMLGGDLRTFVLWLGDWVFAARLASLKRVVFVREGLQDPESRTLREIIWDRASACGFRVRMNNPLLDQLAEREAYLGAAVWYEELRRRWQPKKVRVLLIGESVPDPGDGSARFFYAEPLTAADNLYRAVVEAFLGKKAGVAGDAKQDRLMELWDRGVFLIDLVPEPVNHLPAKERAQARRKHVSSCAKRVRQLAPSEGVIICHAPSFRVLQAELEDVLRHHDPLPFPLGNRRAEFIAGVRQAVELP